MAQLKRYRVVDAYNSGIDLLAIQIDPTANFYASATIPVSTDGTPLIDDYTQLFEYDVSGNLIYQGRAAPGTDPASPVWQIKRFTYSGTSVVAIEYANGSAMFASAWNDRGTLPYS